MAGLDDLLAEGASSGGGGSFDGEHSAGGTPNGELTLAARESLAGNWFLVILGSTLFSLLMFAAMVFSGAYAFYLVLIKSASAELDEALVSSVVYGTSQGVLYLLYGAVAVGFNHFFLGMAQQNEANLNYLFTGFRRFWASLGTMFLSQLLIFLWTLLLIVPGIIASFRYSMVYFVLADDPEAGPIEALRRSSTIMKGNKWKLFCLYFRFIFWWILSSLTGGLAYLWLIPYIQTAKAQFYEDIKWNQFG